MLFSSTVFIFIFLPLILFLYYINKNRSYRNIVLCLFSFLFYAWGEPKYIVLIILSIILNYLLVIFFSKYEKYKKPIFIGTVILNVLLLVVFKYLDFGIMTVNNVFGLDVKLLNILLPVGISFYTFQILSYVIDAYKGKVKVQRNIIKLSTYVALFPQLIAGPIVRYETIEDELTNRKETFDDFILGVKRFILGLGKKVIIANNMALIADTIYAQPGSDLGTGMIWIAAIAYTLQIYFDFSGYSDMAIGLGKMFGFNFLENFNYPYIASSITDFWRRWHISLSSWFKDYIYIPLGGNKCSKLKWIRNIFIVWGLTGLWHGANWNFILWGLYFGILLLLERTIFKNILPKIPKVVKHILTIILIIISWIIFRIENVNDIFIYVSRLFVYKESNYDIFLNNFDLVIACFYVIPAIVLSLPFVNKYFEKFMSKNFVFEGIGYIICLFIFVFSIAMLLSNTYNPFIYFRF